jgi:RNA polymerase sigma-70 factor (ECF subfamily)
MKQDMTVILAKEGHPDAFRKLYEEHGHRIYRIAFRHTQSQQDAEDIMQETFIKAFKRIDTFKFQLAQSFSAWLNTICLNCTIDHFRRQRSKRQDRQVSLTDLYNELHTHNPSPEKTIETEQAAEHIRESLALLPAKQRLIFEMRYHQQLPIKDIAHDLQCSQSTVKTQIFRAQRRLRKTLEPIWGKP